MTVTATEIKPGTGINAVWKFFKSPDKTVQDGDMLVRASPDTLKEFAAEWKDLPEGEKEEIRRGITDSSLTY